MKLLHWNVNGIRAIMKKQVLTHKSFESCVSGQRADIIVLSETKIAADSRETHDGVNLLFTDYPHQYHAHARKRGYSGVSVYSKVKPARLIRVDNEEGRLVVLEYAHFVLVAVYVPNAGSKLARLSYRTETWDTYFLTMCKQLSARKPIVIAGDLNVAHMDKDIAHPERHRGSAGFTDAERGNFDKLLRTCNLLDTWRVSHEDEVAYTYFDYRTKARQRNVGWRIDYILVSAALQSKLESSSILTEVTGSDHLPITCTLII